MIVCYRNVVFQSDHYFIDVTFSDNEKIQVFRNGYICSCHFTNKYYKRNNNNACKHFMLFKSNLVLRLVNMFYTSNPLIPVIKHNFCEEECVVCLEKISKDGKIIKCNTCTALLHKGCFFGWMTKYHNSDVFSFVKKLDYFCLICNSLNNIKIM
jgi:hypothetical protein